MESAGGRSARALRVDLWPLLLVGVVLAAFLPVLWADFVNLDDALVSGNEWVRGPGPIPVRELFSLQLFTPHYKPLVFLSWAVEYRLSGSSPFIFHLDNLLLHAANGVLLYLLLLTLFKRLGADDRFRRAAAFFGAALFALHPMRVESVAWAVERKDVLFAFFYLMTLLVYLKGIARRSVGFQFAGGVLFLLSLLSKQTALTLPLALVLIDYLLGRRPGRRLLVEKLPYLAVLPIGLYLYGFANLLEMESLVPTSAGVSSEQGGVGPVSVVLGAVVSLCYRLSAWLGRTVMPLGLSPAYPVPDFLSQSTYPAYLAIYPLLVAAVVVIAIRSTRHTRTLAFGLAFFAVTLLPVLVLRPDETAFVSDRYTYVPSIGLFFVVSAGMSWLLARRAAAARRVAWLTGAVILGLAILTFRQTLVWQDSATLWEHVITNHPTAASGWYGRGETRRVQGDPDGAASDYRQAGRLDPRHHRAWNNLGDVYRSQGRFEEALAAFDRSIEAAPRYARAYNNRGLTYFAMASYPRAIDDYSAALALEPGAWEVLDNRAQARLAAGDLQGALQDSLEAERLENGGRE